MRRIKFEIFNDLPYNQITDKHAHDKDDDSYDDGAYDQVYIRGAVETGLPLQNLNTNKAKDGAASTSDTITRINNPYYDDGASSMDEGICLNYFLCLTDNFPKSKTPNNICSIFLNLPL